MHIVSIEDVQDLKDEEKNLRVECTLSNDEPYVIKMKVKALIELFKLTDSFFTKKGK